VGCTNPAKEMFQKSIFQWGYKRLYKKVPTFSLECFTESGPLPNLCWYIQRDSIPAPEAKDKDSLYYSHA
jgi:hypothetical protein